MTWLSEHLEHCLMLAAGLVCLALWRSLGNRAYEFQKRVFNVPTSERAYQAAYFVAGLLLVVLSVLEALGALHFGR